MRNLLFFLYLAVFSLFITSVAQAQQWAKTYGGAYVDRATSIQQTSDGGYIVAGETASFGAGGFDIWVLKLDSSGNVQWQKTYGGADFDKAYSIQQTSDGGYIVAGWTWSFGAGYNDFWVLKLDSSGNVQWQKTYGGADYDEAYSIQQTSDGGYIVAGETASFGAGGFDIWVLKLDSSGNVQWQKTYGGASSDWANSIQQTSDGGYIVAGGTFSFGAGDFDIWVLKLDSSGNVQWQKTYGGAGSDEAYSIQQTSDGGYIVAGWTKSFGAGYSDVWVLKLDSSGNVQWQKTYGGAGYDEAYSIQQTSDGGYIVAGRTWSFGAGGWDVWVLKLDSSGNVQWQKTYGGADWEFARSIQQTSDGGYIVAGRTKSFSFGADSIDIWVLKLDSSGNITDCTAQGSSSAAVNTTSVTGDDTGAIVESPTTVSVSDSDATPNLSSASTTEVCYYAPTYTLMVNKAGTGSGTVTSDDGGINCGTDCTETYNEGTVVTLTATPDPGSTFAGWSGDCSGTNPTIQITMNSDKTCTATFNTTVTPTYTLTVNKAGTGSGTVTSNDGGINCGTDCTETYNAGTTVTLTATPDPGSTFAGWSGDCSGTNPTIQITMDSDKTCTATFNTTGGGGGAGGGAGGAGGGLGGCSMSANGSPLNLLIWLIVPTLIFIRRSILRI